MMGVFEWTHPFASPFPLLVAHDQLAVYLRHFERAPFPRQPFWIRSTGRVYNRTMSGCRM